MRHAHRIKLVIPATACALALGSRAGAFEGRIAVELVSGVETSALLYTIGPEHLRIENVATNWPHPINTVELKSGAVTLLFPHNRSFVRLKSPAVAEGGDPRAGTIEKPGSATPATTLPATTLSAPPMPTPPGGLPPGIGPQPPSTGPGVPGMPQMPPMPMPPSVAAATFGAPGMGEKLELKPTGKKEKILGFECEQFELKQRGKIVEI